MDASIWSIDENVKCSSDIIIKGKAKSICTDPNHVIKDNDNVKDPVGFMTPEGWVTGIVNYSKDKIGN